MKPTKRRGRPSKFEQFLRSLPEEAKASIGPKLYTLPTPPVTPYIEKRVDMIEDVHGRRLRFLLDSVKIGYIIEVVALLIAVAALLWTTLT